MKSLLLCVSIITLFCSCDPGHAINLTNNTGKAHTVTYIESPKKIFNRADSLFTFDTAAILKPTTIQWLKVQTDTVAKTYTLVLASYRKVNLQHCTGRIFLKNLDQKVVIDGLDTIILNKDKRVSLSKNSSFMSTEVVITVQ